MDVSYFPGAISTALHTDMCSPVATDPTWSRLPAIVKRALWKDGHKLWHDLVRALEPHVILASIAKQYATRIQFPRKGSIRELLTIDRTKPYAVTVEELEVTQDCRSLLVKGNAAQLPFGKVNNDDKRRIGETLREALGV
jgi:hypothetical protein